MDYRHRGEKGLRMARIIDKPRVIEVPAKEKDGEL